MTLLRKLFLLAAKNNFTVTLKHRPGKTNDIADALSDDRFFSLTPQTQKAPTLNPWVSESALNAQLQNLISLSVASSTRSNYGSRVRKFQQFCNHAATPSRDRDTVVYLAVFLTRSLAPSSIQVYLGGSASMGTGIQHGMHDPRLKNGACEPTP